MSEPQDPSQNPPGWTDPYSDPVGDGGAPPMGPGQLPTGPGSQPPGSPLLTGLIVGLLLVALSVALFQLFGPDDDGTAAGTTTTTTDPTDTTSTTEGTSTTTSSTTSLPTTDPYPPVDPPIPAEKIKMMTGGLRINDDDIKDLIFGTEADLAIGRLVASFGDPDPDTGWQTSTGRYGVCAGDLERVLIFETFAAIVTKSGGQNIFNGYRNDLTSGGGLTTDPASIESLSGLKIGDTVETMQDIYASQRVVFGSDPKLGSIYEIISSSSGVQLLWGPVEGDDPADRVIGIYAPDICNR